MPIGNRQHTTSKLDPNDRVRIKFDVADLEDQLNIIKSKESTAASGLDVTKIRSSLNKKKNVLVQDESMVAKGNKKDVMAKRAKVLEGQFMKDMPSYAQMWPSKHWGPDHERHVRQQMNFDKNHGDKVREWKDIQRCLDPDNPEAGSIERIRPQN